MVSVPERGPQRWLHGLFELGVTLKLVIAAAETLCGLALLLVTPGWIVAGARWFTSSEISEDPADRLARWFLHAAEGLSISTQHFWAFYLIAHGVLKLAVLGALLLGYRWAYPAAIAVMSGFILLQVHHFLAAGSPVILILSLFDLIVIALIWQEYNALGPRTD